MDTNKIFSLLKSRITKLGASVIYSALLLFYAFRHSDTPTWAKHIITGSLAYLVSPIDNIPDLTPFLGYTDDLSVMSFALVGIACYINDEIREKAKKQLSTWLPGDHSQEVSKIDGIL